MSLGAIEIDLRIFEDFTVGGGQLRQDIVEVASALIDFRRKLVSSRRT